MHASIVTIQVNPRNLNEFLDSMREHARVSAETEPGCLRYDVVQDLADPNRIHVYEVFEDEAAFNAHRYAAHNLEWRDIIKDWRAPESISRHCVTVYPPDSAWQKAVK